MGHPPRWQSVSSARCCPAPSARGPRRTTPRTRSAPARGRNAARCGSGGRRWDRSGPARTHLVARDHRLQPHANRMQPGGPMLRTGIMDMARGAAADEPSDLRRARRYSRWRSAPAAPPPSSACPHAAPRFAADRAGGNGRGLLVLTDRGPSRSSCDLPAAFPGFQRVAAYRPNDSTLETPGAPLRLVAGDRRRPPSSSTCSARSRCSAALFRDGETRAGTRARGDSQPFTLWQELGADPAIVGKTVQLGGFSANDRRRDATWFLVSQPVYPPLDLRAAQSSKPHRNLYACRPRRRRYVAEQSGRAAPIADRQYSSRRVQVSGTQWDKTQELRAAIPRASSSSARSGPA